MIDERAGGLVPPDWFSDALKTCVAMDFTTGEKYARYEVGLNGFKYCASLHIDHPSISPAEITKNVGLTPDRCHEKGDPRTTPKGGVLTGVYPATYWSTILKLEDGLSMDEFLLSLVTLLQPRGESLREIHATGGRICCFVGIHGDRLCDTEFPCELLTALGDLRIDLRLDYYGPKNSPPDETSS